MNENMPESFRITYPFTRATLDCTEEKVQTPSSKVLNSQITRNTKTTPHVRVSLVLHLVELFHSLVLYTLDGFQTKKSQLDPEYLIYYMYSYISNEINVYLGSSSRAPQNLLTLFWLKFCWIIFTIIPNFDLD